MQAVLLDALPKAQVAPTPAQPLTWISDVVYNAPNVEEAARAESVSSHHAETYLAARTL
jgi:hypothetical protein